MGHPLQCEDTQNMKAMHALLREQMEMSNAIEELGMIQLAIENGGIIPIEEAVKLACRDLIQMRDELAA